MNIKPVGSTNIIKIYNDNKKNLTTNKLEKKNDSLEISDLGKSLSNLALEIPNIDNTEKVEKIKNQITKGIYKPNPELIAKRMIDIMRGREL